MSKHPYDQLTLNNGGAFIFTPCPGTKETSIAESISQLKEAGTQAIVTLMYDDELERNHAQSLAAECEKQSVMWFQLPISDEDAPNEDFLYAMKTQLASILAIVEQQGVVAVHCKGGSGRTGLVIGLLMYHLGYQKEEIITLVQSFRPKALTHPVQLDYFNKFELLGI
jgi:protein-tyrosine phosphatase